MLGGRSLHNAVMTFLVVILAFVAAGCQDDEPDSAGLPAPVAETRSAILSAAESGDYDRLRPLIDLEVFLSEGGFGKRQPDPVARWRKLGTKPLETMAVLLQMPHQVRETNEGTLYQWPRFGPDSKRGDVSESERALLRTVMTEAEVRNLILPEYGYTAPRLGILANGTWWFFILEGGP